MKIGRNDPCWCGSQKKYKKCHGRTASTAPPRPARDLQIMTPDELPKMRAACKLAANILAEVCEKVQVGTTTQEIDDWVLARTLEAGAYPAPLNYPNPPTDPRNPTIAPRAFPKNVCTSVNEIVCHGIPSSDVVLRDGDIVNIDVTCQLDGYYGDTSRMVYVGTPSEDAKRVTECARKCLQLGIEAVKPNGELIDVGHAIYDHATKQGLGVVREYTGHGVGRIFHAEPQVCHYPNRHSNCRLLPGMTFTIEPMINLGTWKTQLDERDHWTVYTLDGKLSAQFEHTLIVTDKGAEILTLPD